MKYFFLAISMTTSQVAIYNNSDNWKQEELSSSSQAKLGTVLKSCEFFGRFDHFYRVYRALSEEHSKLVPFQP